MKFERPGRLQQIEFHHVRLSVVRDLGMTGNTGLLRVGERADTARRRVEGERRAGWGQTGWSRREGQTDDGENQ